VLFDTFARCLCGGDENSAKDVGLAIAGLDRIRTALDATVGVGHHSGKNAETERGSSALRGAADTMIALNRGDAETVLRSEKQKDRAAFEDFRLRLRTVELDGTNSSCVLDPVTPTSRGVGASPGAKRALVALIQCADDEGLSYSEWREVADLPKRSFARHR